MNTYTVLDLENIYIDPSLLIANQSEDSYNCYKLKLDIIELKIGAIELKIIIFNREYTE